MAEILTKKSIEFNINLRIMKRKTNFKQMYLVDRTVYDKINNNDAIEIQFMIAVFLISEKMAHFINTNQDMFGSNIKKFLKEKMHDCHLYSEDGKQINIHSEIFGQTAFLREILNQTKKLCSILL